MHRILDTVRDIPEGAVASYGQVAEIAGVTRGARQVGYTLRHLPEGEELPWHRVIRSSGEIAFPPGTPQFAEQERRLLQENVRVSNGRVDMQRYSWCPDLDEFLWKPTDAWDQE